MKRTLAIAAIGLGMSVGQAVAADVPAADRAQIIDAITAIAAGADRHDWDRVRSAFADTVTSDYTSLWGGDPVTQPADALVGQWAGFLPGFEITQHLVTNHTIADFGGATADVEADFQATHRIGAAAWVLGGRYDYRLAKSTAGWRVTHLTMTATWETGDRDLVTQAGERAADSQRGANLRAVEAFYANLERKDMTGFLELFREDAVQDMPYAPPGFPSKVEGRSGIAALFADFPTATDDVSFSDLTIYPTDNPNRLIAEVSGRIEFKGNDAPYHQNYVSIFEFEDGRISLFREYFNPLPFAEATGLGRFEANDNG